MTSYGRELALNIADNDQKATAILAQALVQSIVPLSQNLATDLFWSTSAVRSPQNKNQSLCLASWGLALNQ
jgi:hypothetical protein